MTPDYDTQSVVGCNRRLRQNITGQLTADRARKTVLLDLVQQRATRDAKRMRCMRAVVTILNQRTRDLGAFCIAADGPQTLRALHNLLRQGVAHGHRCIRHNASLFSQVPRIRSRSPSLRRVVCTFVWIGGEEREIRSDIFRRSVQKHPAVTHARAHPYNHLNSVKFSACPSIEMIPTGHMSLPE